MTQPTVAHRFVIAFIAASILGVLGAPAPLAAEGLEASGAWIRLPPPGANAAGYLTIVNPTAEPLKIVGISSDVGVRTELHRSWVEDGVARMRKVEAVEVPAHGSVELAPKGLHVMLIRPEGLREGQVVTLRFEVEAAGGANDSRVWVVEAEVRRAHGGGQGAH